MSSQQAEALRNSVQFIVTPLQQMHCSNPSKGSYSKPQYLHSNCTVQYQYIWRRKFPGSKSNLCIQILFWAVQVNGINSPTPMPSDMHTTIWKSLRECLAICLSTHPVAFELTGHFQTSFTKQWRLQKYELPQKSFSTSNRTEERSPN